MSLNPNTQTDSLATITQRDTRMIFRLHALVVSLSELDAYLRVLLGRVSEYLEPFVAGRDLQKSSGLPGGVAADPPSRRSFTTSVVGGAFRW